MSDYRYPFGYSGNPQGMGQLLTWEQMMGYDTVRLLHPEVLRRFHAMIQDGASRGVALGVGTGWRIQPNPPPPGFAQPGNSWHESCPCSPTTASALAIDTVPNISWDWMESVAATYGFQTFRNVNNEPWHIQPIEIPKGRNYATTLPPLLTFELPGGDDDMPLNDADKQWISQEIANQVTVALKQQFAPSGECYQRLDPMVRDSVWTKQRIDYAKQNASGESNVNEPASKVLSAAASYAGRATKT